MKTIALIIMVATLLEALVEYAKTIITMFEEKEYKTAATQGITIIIGIFLAFVFNLQLFNGAMSEFYSGLVINSTIDTVLTGLLFSRGSNYISDLISKLSASNKINDLAFDFEADEIREDIEEKDEA